MHPNRAFRDVGDARNLAFARQQGFGILTVSTSADEPPLVSHIPFRLNEAGTEAEMHLARPNPIVKALETPRPARLVIQGPHDYISPDWYGATDQVPTWNYVAVHLTGTLALLDADTLHPMLDRLSDTFESRLAPKPAWTSGKMTDGVMERMMRAILPCRLTITGIDGTWKLSQNKPEAVRLAAAEGLAQADGDAALAALMRDPPQG